MDEITTAEELRLALVAATAGTAYEVEPRGGGKFLVSTDCGVHGFAMTPSGIAFCVPGTHVDIEASGRLPSAYLHNFVQALATTGLSIEHRLERGGQKPDEMDLDSWTEALRAIFAMTEGYPMAPRIVDTVGSHCPGVALSPDHEAEFQECLSNYLTVLHGELEQPQNNMLIYNPACYRLPGRTPQEINRIVTELWRLSAANLRAVDSRGELDEFYEVFKGFNGMHTIELRALATAETARPVMDFVRSADNALAIHYSILATMPGEATTEMLNLALAGIMTQQRTAANNHGSSDEASNDFARAAAVLADLSVRAPSQDLINRGSDILKISGMGLDWLTKITADTTVDFANNLPAVIRIANGINDSVPSILLSQIDPTLLLEIEEAGLIFTHEDWFNVVSDLTENPDIPLTWLAAAYDGEINRNHRSYHKQLLWESSHRQTVCACWTVNDAW